ncbi:hypothetical protein B0H19DRAFT_1174876 [Mycena capillaripes]|nr:hypothetical protein B0H19DRAFT_1174876 [Mycena capillaripes]
MAMSPPPPFPDFDFNFDPSLFPNPPPLPASADLFSAAETTDLLGFLDNFNDFGWENDQQTYPSPRAPYSNPHLNTAPEPSGRPRRSTRSSASTRAATQQQQHQQQKQQQQPQPQRQQYRREYSERSDSQTPSNASESSSHTNGNSPRAPALPYGYAQLIALLAPAGSAPGLGMPQRGRPKGSGSRGKGQSKGKSGVLFRAVEYIHWLEEGRDAMRAEVLRVEAAAGIRDGAGNR